MASKSKLEAGGKPGGQSLTNPHAALAVRNKDDDDGRCLLGLLSRYGVVQPRQLIAFWGWLMGGGGVRFAGMCGSDPRDRCVPRGVWTNAAGGSHPVSASFFFLFSSKCVRAQLSNTTLTTLRKTQDPSKETDSGQMAESWSTGLASAAT